jgi:peptidoglycan/xylan/chitin deacetylase (PgdA/CDA1 family)
MFHHFHDDKKHPQGQGSITSEQFRKMILLLQKEYNLISAMEWFEKSKNQKLEHKDICITFDDNLLCQYDIALPVLEEFGIKAFWFIYSSPLFGVKENLEIYRYFRSTYATINEFYNSFNDFLKQSNERQEFEEKIKLLDTDQYLSSFPFYTVEDKIFRYTRDQILGKDRYYKIMDEMIAQSNMNVDEISLHLWNGASAIKYLSDTGHIIGLHSHTHPTAIKMMSYPEQLSEYTNNKIALESIIGSEIFSMSHPCNSYNDDTLKILQSMNVNFGFRANMDSGYSSTLEYPRLDHALLIDKVK